MDTINNLSQQILNLKPNSIHEVIPSAFFTKYDSYDYVWCGNCFEIYYALSKLVQPTTFLEFGVRFGFSFLPTMLGSEKLVYARGYDNESYGSITISQENISKYYTGKAKFELIKADTQDIVALDKFYDLISVDGVHTYGGKLHDLGLTIDHSKYVVVDDYDYHAIVRKAVDKFVETNKSKIKVAAYVPSFRGTMIIQYHI